MRIATAVAENINGGGVVPVSGGVAGIAVVMTGIDKAAGVEAVAIAGSEGTAVRDGAAGAVRSRHSGSDTSTHNDRAVAWVRTW